MLPDLWNSAASVTGTFGPAHVASVPEPARHYLEHAIAPGTTLASTVRLRMRGEIKIGGWLPFDAEQVIHADRGFVWTATIRRFAIPLFRGFDRLVDGAGEMRWKLLGVLPIVTGSGPDVTRSAFGRMDVESLWLPSVLVREDVRWTARNGRHAVATFTRHAQVVEFEVDERGRLESIQMERWGNPGGGTFRLEPFGGVVDRERAFGGYTIPSRVRVGWYFGTPRFEAEGEFFRATIEDATFR
jgi:hypothetical protein